MSKRFGRNQKRRLVQELEQYERINSTLVQTAGVQISEISRLESRLRAAEAVLGVYNPAFPPKRLEALGPHGRDPEYRVPFPGGGAAHPMTITTRDLIDHSSQVHAVLTYKHHAWGYAISEQAMHSYPREVLAGHIADVFTNMVLDELNKLGVRR